ncbi:hypothetical protein BGZ93_004570 [Podila epicladia]|nr:hypothetical protein BGZ92_007084 [Podila epicladia]KAG0096408.1 hypothetical protein BGZ93_004570 [Podila epicladia]
MRTAELINLLRNPERNATAREHLSTLHHTVLVHLLGELANWLTVEIVKYQERQTPSSSSPTPSSSPQPAGDKSLREVNGTLETFQQYQIRKQIRLTLSAIQTVLGNVQATSRSMDAIEQNSQGRKTIALDDTKQEQILDSLLRPIMTGCVPLGPRADSSEIQLMCAKILKFFTNRRNENGFFPTEDVIKRILALSDANDRPHDINSQEQAKKKPRLTVDLSVTLYALLSSPLVKLQDCGIFLLANHRTLRQRDAAWASISPLKSILESLRRNLDDIGLGHLESGIDDAGRQTVTKELDATLSHQHRALTLLNLFIQDVVHKSREGESSHRNTNTGTTRLRALKAVGEIGLFVDLWTGILRIVIPDQARFSVRDQIVAMTTNVVYGTCYVFKDEAIGYLMNQGAETLMAWYAYFIVPRDHLLEEGLDASGKSEEDSYKSRAQALQCCARLGEIMVMTERYQPVSMGEEALLGKIFMRRSIEFLVTILEVTLPTEDAESNPSDAGAETVMTMTTATYAIRIISQRPEVLEAMLGILVCTRGYLKSGYMETETTKLMFVLVVLLVDLKSLFGQIMISASSQQRIHSHVLSLLVHILSWEVDTGLQDIPLNLWSLGCEALVEMIMLPLERIRDATGQQNASLSQQMDSHGVKAVQIFIQFWKQYPKGRSLLAALYGPRFFQPFMISILLDISKNDLSLAPSRAMTLTSWNMERISNLLELMTYLGVESSVRIHMRESWSALIFLAALLSASLRRSLDHRFKLSDYLPYLVAHQCFLALACFRFDQTALVQLTRMDLDPESFDLFGCSLDKFMLPDSITTGSPGRNPASVSIVPVLLGMLTPPYRQWTVDIMLGTDSIKDDKHRVMRRKLEHPLLERLNPLVLEAAMLLSTLTQFQEGQLAVMSKPGAVWTMSRILVERAIAQEQQRTPQPQEPGPQVQAILENGSPCAKSPLEIALEGTSQGSSTAVRRYPPAISALQRNPLDKALLEVLTRIVSSTNLTKALVVNNTITELFSSILAIDHPLYFHRNITVCCQEKLNGTGSDEASTHDTSTLLGYDILPSACQHSIYCMLFAYFRQAMEPLFPQLQRLHGFAAGGASATADDAEEISDMLFGLQEQCAVVFLYLSRPESLSSLDSSDLLASESHLGDVLRMLTLEMDYIDSDANKMDIDKLALEGVHREAAALRKFMAGLAIQPWTWRHVDTWRERHEKLMHSYDNVLITEREDHVEKLKRQETSASSVPVVPIRFLVQSQVILFSDRSLLARASSYFSSLLTGEFLESHQDQVTLHDVDPVDIQMLLECLQESLTMPSNYLLPEDLPFELVLRLMICAERYSIQFLKRLAELWILTSLQKRERKWHDPAEQENNEVETKKRIPESPVSGHEDKKAKVEYGDLVMEQVYSGDEEPPETEEGEEESIQECLLMVYEQCSNPRHGDIYIPQHPFFGLVWDVLARICLRLGSVAILPRFQRMFEQGGEEKIQEFLKVVHVLMVNQAPE